MPDTARPALDLAAISLPHEAMTRRNGDVVCWSCDTPMPCPTLELVASYGRLRAVADAARCYREASGVVAWYCAERDLIAAVDALENKNG